MEKIDLMELELNTPGVKPFSFTNLRKETAGETYKYWNKLLKSESIKNIENFNEIISPSEPLPSFEEKLRLILIDSLQLKNEVVKVFLSRNDYSIKRILRCKWFFRDLSAEFCTKEIFPRVSVSVRFKIINRLSKYLESEEEAEKFFTFIATNLNKETAEILLPKCTSGFILNYWEKERPIVDYLLWRKERILYKICRRYPETCLQILSLNCESKKRYNTFPLGNCKALLQYLAGNHTDLFIPFFKKHADQFYTRTFSGKLSKKLLVKLKDFLFESKLINSAILNEKYVFFKLDTNERIKFLAAKVVSQKNKLTFKNWYESRSQLVNLIKCIRPSCRYSMIKSVFKEVYNLNFEDHSKCWFADLLELLPASDRLYFVENIEAFHQSSETEFVENVETICFRQEEPERVIYLYEFNVAFDKLKNIIVKSPDKFRRQKIISYMVKCCRINDDVKGLEEVVDFVAKRHRHEDPNILFEFANVICNTFPAVELNSDICQKIVKLLLFCCVKGFFDTYSFSRLTEREIYLRLESNKETDDLVKKFFEFVILKRGCYYSFLSDYKNKHSRTLLLNLGKEVQEYIRTHPNDHTSQMTHCAWIKTCEEFNKVNKKNKLVLRDLPGYAETVKGLFKTKYNKLGVEDWPLDTLETCNVHFLNPDYTINLLFHLLKTNPAVIVKHLEAVLDQMDLRFCPAFVKQLCFLGVTDKLKEITLNKFQKGTVYYKRINALTVYSYLCTIEEFTSVVQDFMPEDDLVKEGAEYNFTQIQLEIPKMIMNIRPRWKNLNLILKFFRGDFLKQVIYSFSCCCYHSSVDFIIPFLKNHLYTVPQKVSYIKDIIKLICVLSTRDEKINFCLKCWDENKHYSIRRIILQFLSKSFFECPTRELFNAIVKCILDSEEAIMDMKPDLQKMPEEFVNEYAMTLWKYSKKISAKENFQRTIIWSFNLENINLLSAEFCEEIIRENLFNPKSAVSVNEFAVYYCAVCPDMTGSRIEMILKLLRELPKGARRATSFLDSVKCLSLCNPAQYMNLISILVEKWPECQDLYEEKLMYMYYNFYYRILQTSKEQNVVSVDFAKQLRTFYSGVAELKDLTIILADTLKNFINELITAGLPLHPLVVARELMEQSHDRTLAIIAMQAVPPRDAKSYQKSNAFNADDDKTTLNEIIRILENKKDDILWIYFGRTFKTPDH